jgi:serine/threonine protein phosphatase 1
MRRNNLLRFEARSTASFPRIDGSKRIYAIGDIHGRFDLLMKLMNIICEDALARADHRQTCFIFMGDYIDRGEETAEVLETLNRMAEFRSKHIVFLRGNHEAALQHFLESPADAAEWLDFGGLQTLLSFGIKPPRFGAGHKDLERVRDELASRVSDFGPLLGALVNVYRSGNVVFAHAGIDPATPLEDQSEDTLIWGHPRGLVDQPIKGIGVVHGHYDDASAVSRPGRICVDTGAYYSGILTAVRLDDETAFLSTKD